MKTYFHKNLEKLKRRYFEVFGDLEAQAEFLKLSNLALLGILIAVLLGAFLLAHRPPVVIRVTEVGAAEPIRDFRINNAPSEPEILYFSFDVKAFKYPPKDSIVSEIVFAERFFVPLKSICSIKCEIPFTFLLSSLDPTLYQKPREKDCT